jgi:hypothetical protein
MPATDAINQRVTSLCKPDLHPTSSFFPCNFMPSSNSTTSISYDENVINVALQTVFLLEIH